MAEPITSKAVASGIMSIASAVGGKTEHGKKSPLLISLFTLLLFLLFVVMVPVYILLSPLEALFGGNAAINSFKDKYGNAVVSHSKTEQIGIYPLPSHTSVINSNFGGRDNPLSGIGDENHTGVDFATNWHEQIVAIADGTVVKTGVDKNFGTYILIKHIAEDETFYTFYAHLSSTYVVRKQKVTQFQVVGKEGGDPEKDAFAGRSTGHHLHFEVRTNQFLWSAVDPYDYILKPPPPPEEELEEEETPPTEEKVK